MANRPGTPVRVDGDPSDWPGAAPGGARRGARGWLQLRDVRVTSDEGYLYVLVRTAGGAPGPDWTTTTIRLAIDTYDPERGATRLPGPGAVTIATGAEFLLELQGPGASALKVVAPYEPYRAIDRGPIASPREGGEAGEPFVPLTFEANRERFGRDGTRYPPIRVDRGAIRFGSLDPKAPDYDTRTDVAIGAATGTIELRLPWALLNVTDPSSKRVVHQEVPHDPPLDTLATEGFRIYAFAIDRRRPEKPPVSRIPGADATAPLYSWEGWETPKYRMQPKAGIGRIREAFAALPDTIEPAPVAAGAHRAM
jgi:hypothetical protein